MKYLSFILLFFVGFILADSPEDEFEAFQKIYKNSAQRSKKTLGAVENLVKQEAAVYDRVLDAAKNHSSKEVRGWCCYTLGLMKKEGNAKILADRLKAETNSSVKTHILDGLAMNKGRDPTVAEAVMTYLKNYGKDLAPQDIELALTVLSNYAAGPNKVPASEAILTLMNDYYENLHLRPTLIRLYAKEFLYPIIRDRLLNQYVVLSVGIKKEGEMGDLLTLLIQIARYRKKGPEVFQDYGAWSYLINLCINEYLLQIYLSQISMFCYQNKPLRDLVDRLFGMAEDAKNKNQKERIELMLKTFEEIFPTQKITLSGEDDKKKGLEKTLLKLQEWDKFWKQTRASFPTPPAYEPYSVVEFSKLQADAVKKRDADALLKAKEEFKKEDPKKPK
ncbi:MAG: hypothetical protein AABZ60_04725 [Planctomycetota bacterium]